MALKIINSPLNIATKSFILNKFQQKENPFDDKGQLNLTKFENEFHQFLDMDDK